MTPQFPTSNRVGGDGKLYAANHRVLARWKRPRRHRPAWARSTPARAGGKVVALLPHRPIGWGDRSRWWWSWPWWAFLECS